MGFVFLILSYWSEAANMADSLRTEIIDGKTFIIHQVDPKETLYGLSRRYNTSLEQILLFNSEANTGLNIGQILKIPSEQPMLQESGLLHEVQPRETIYSIAKRYNMSVNTLKSLNLLTKNTLSVGQKLRVIATNKPAIPTPSPQGPLEKNHRVAQGETLYSIAQRYNKTVEQLKQWNKITDNTLHVGQEIRIANVPIGNTPVTNAPGLPINLSEKVTGSDEVRELGLAMLIEGDISKRKYLALHHSAPNGTILKIRNTKNDLEIFVRVIGVLPTTTTKEEPIITKISRSAFSRLGGANAPIHIELTYYK